MLAGGRQLAYIIGGEEKTRMKTIVFATVAALVVALAGPGTAHAIRLNCPQVLRVKAVAPPYPWEDVPYSEAVLHFAEASYSCSNGTCTLSCAYSTPGSIYTLIKLKVPPGTCHYTNEGNSFDCTSLPPEHARRRR